MSNKIFYKPENAFKIESGITSLKEYDENLIALLGSQFDLLIGKGIKTPTVNNAEFENYGPFEGSTQRMKVSGSVAYDSSNFQDFEHGTISMWVKSDKEDGTNYSKQTLRTVKSTSENLLPYILGVDVSNEAETQHYEIEISLEGSNDLEGQVADIYESVRNALGYNEEYTTNFPHQINVSKTETDVTFFTNYETDKINIVDVVAFTGEYIDLRTLFTSVSPSTYFNAPTEDVDFFKLDGEFAGITLTHKTDGNIWGSFEGITNELLLCRWGHTNREWMNLEIGFNEQVVVVLQDGVMKNMLPTSGILREKPETSLVLSGSDTDPYYFGEVAFYNEVKHIKNFDLPTKSMPIYSTENPYLSIHYGVVRTYEDRTVALNSSGEVGYTLYSGPNPIIGGTTYGDSLDKTDFENKFKEHIENSTTHDFSDMTLRVYFHSDGSSSPSFTSAEFYYGTVEPNDDKTNPSNFDGLFGFIKRSLGWPRVPCELTDDQMLDALNQAVYHYKRFRNYKTNMDVTDTATLSRAEDGSFYLPAGLDSDDIMEVIFKPRYSWTWYSGDNNLMANLYMQNLFSGYDLSKSAADYYIAFTTQNDLRNILGTQSGWSIMNGRLYLFPKFDGLETMNIGIKYRETVSIEEINTNVQIKQLALAYAKITLGNIRATFGNQIPGGDSMITLNGTELIQQGQTERDTLIQDFIKQQPILQMIWT